MGQAVHGNLRAEPGGGGAVDLRDARGGDRRARGLESGATRARIDTL